MVITEHKFLDAYPVDLDSKKILVGTIHPHKTDQFELPFFYGNVSSLWKILSDAFPEELPQPIQLDNVLGFLKSRKIAMSDVIRKCERQDPSSTEDEELTPMELNYQLFDDIRNTSVNQVLFTSSFAKNAAFKLFYRDMLQLPITSEIRSNKKVRLPPSIFGKPVELKILYSPSGMANAGISQSREYKANQHRYANSKRPVYDFRVDQYRQALG